MTTRHGLAHIRQIGLYAWRSGVLFIPKDDAVGERARQLPMRSGRFDNLPPIEHAWAAAPLLVRTPGTTRARA